MTAFLMNCIDAKKKTINFNISSFTIISDIIFSSRFIISIAFDDHFVNAFQSALFEALFN